MGLGAGFKLNKEKERDRSKEKDKEKEKEREKDSSIERPRSAHQHHAGHLSAHLSVHLHDHDKTKEADEDRERQTPWNTYAKKGLPDTPIASPGVEALQAVERPADGDWLYFVTVDQEGTTVFNRDFQAHEDAIEESRANGVLDSAR